MSAKKNKKIIEESPTELNPAEIHIHINEIGNIEQFKTNNDYEEQYFFLIAEFDGQTIPTTTNNIFDMCRCAPNDTVNAIWLLNFLNITDEEIYKFSTCPIIITLQTFPIPDEGVKKLPSNTSNIKTIGYFPIYLSKMLSVKDINLTGTQSIGLSEQPSYTELITWPNTPYICYNIKSINPIFKAPPSLYPLEENISEPIIDIPLINLSLTFECIINMKKEFLNNYTFEMAINFPLEKSIKTIKLQNGKVCSINKIDYYKIDTNLINFPGDLKYSTIPTNSKFDNINNFEIPTENCNLNENSLINDKIISFQQFIEFKITKDMFTKFLDTNKLTIEVLLTPTVPKDSNGNQLNQQHLIGIIEILKFKFVGIENMRYIVPLMIFHPSIITSNPPNEQIFNAGTTKPGSPSKGKDPKGRKSANTVTSDNGEYFFNEKNFSTCVIINIEVDQPYIKRLKETFMGNECRTLELKPQYDEKIMNLYMKKTINDFIDECYCKPFDETVECKEYETKIYSMFNKVTTNYSWNMNSHARGKDLLEDIYIFLTNKIHESFNDGMPDLMSHPKYRLQCAIECLELGFNDEAQDLYLMNIYDTNEQADYYVDYAIHNLFICDMVMAKVCCDEAIKCNPKTYSAYLILSYIKFFAKEYSEVEVILLRLTVMCNNFAEAWMALLVLYLSEDRKSQINSILIQLNKFIPVPVGNTKILDNYVCHLHNRKELLWQPNCINNLTDPKLIAIRYFIQWGFLQYAEIGLGLIIHRYSYDSYEYLYHMALIDYYRKDYSSALQRCTGIRCANPNIMFDKKTLIIQCLLEMQSLNAIYELKRIKSPSKRHKLQHNYLIYMKIGRMYMNTKKYRTAIYFWKQCCYSEGTYCSFKLLGLASLKVQKIDCSEICFQMAYKINPFNCVSWGNLAIINFRKKRIEQFKIYAENAKKQPLLDKKILESILNIEDILEQQSDKQILDL